MQNSGTSSTAASEIAERAREDATRFVTEAKQTGKSMISDKQHAAADEIAGVASVLRQTAQSLEQNDQITTGHYAQRAAAGLDRLSNALRDRDIGSLVHQAESFARRSPALFFGGAVAAGFLIARFMKSTEQREAHEEAPGEPSGTRTTGYPMHDYAADYAPASRSATRAADGPRRGAYADTAEPAPNEDPDRGARPRTNAVAGTGDADLPDTPNTPLPRTDLDPDAQVSALLSTDPAAKSDARAADRQRTGGNHAS